MWFFNYLITSETLQLTIELYCSGLRLNPCMAMWQCLCIFICFCKVYRENPYLGLRVIQMIALDNKCKPEVLKGDSIWSNQNDFSSLSKTKTKTKHTKKIPPAQNPKSYPCLRRKKYINPHLLFKNKIPSHGSQ